MFFNSKKRAQAKKEYLEHIRETCKTTSVAEILAEENKSLRADRDVVYQLYEEARDKNAAQEREIEALKSMLEAAHEDERAIADELDSVYKGMETIRNTCNEYLGGDFNDASCKELDDEPVLFDDDYDDCDDFWDCDNPEEAIHDELFERNDDEEEDDDEEECCECPREKAINNVIGCIVDLLAGAQVDEVIDELDTDTIFGVLFG